GVSGAAAQDRMGRLCQATLRRAAGGARLSQPLHPPRRHRQRSSPRRRRQRRHLHVEGLSRQGAGAAESHDTGRPPVHPSLPHPPPARPTASPRFRPYGLFANGGRAENLARVRELLAVPASHHESDDADLSADEPSTSLLPCPCCGGRMIIIGTFERGSTPNT